MDFINISNILNLLTLTGLEIVLGIDNVIFIALLVQPLPDALRKKVRIQGLSIALILRIAMLFGASWMIGLTKPLFEIFSLPVAYKNILFFVGGAFLIVKSSLEIKSMFSPEEHHENKDQSKSKLLSIIYQIIFIDIVLSFDSIITAVGMSPDNLTVIVVAVSIATFVMLFFSSQVSDFIYKHPSVKILGLAFIVLVGVFLISEAIEMSMPKGYLYFSLFFASAIEIINIKLKK